MTLEHLIKENHGTIVDVRTREEFMGGHVVSSINIPLSELEERLEEIKALPTPLILCCASGGRSAQAEDYLSQQGVTCLNGGSWLNVNFYQSLQNKI